MMMARLLAYFTDWLEGKQYIIIYCKATLLPVKERVVNVSVLPLLAVALPAQDRELDGMRAIESGLFALDVVEAAHERLVICDGHALALLGGDRPALFGVAIQKFNYHKGVELAVLNESQLVIDDAEIHGMTSSLRSWASSL